MGKIKDRMIFPIQTQKW